MPPHTHMVVPALRDSQVEMGAAIYNPAVRCPEIFID